MKDLNKPLRCFTKVSQSYGKSDVYSPFVYYVAKDLVSSVFVK